ncbi:MAG: thiamine diphosphokinase [Opitutales bacterium]|nr:thiamine diphosphokinase [Opitutales bacterium]
MIVDEGRYRSVLCLDGELPVEFLKQTHLPLIAADGAANRLVENGLEPIAIVGDCDSVRTKLLQQYPHVRDASQETTDFEKAFSYLKKENLLPTIVVGMSGGCLDRILSNVFIFSKTDALFLSDTQIGFALTGKRTFDWEADTKVSLFGCPHAIVTSHGLKWELNRTELAFGGFQSCSNRVQTSPLTLEVEGKVLVFTYRCAVRDAGSL